jgi:hypothetical protein
MEKQHMGLLYIEAMIQANPYSAKGFATMCMYHNYHSTFITTSAF